MCPSGSAGALAPERSAGGAAPGLGKAGALCSFRRGGTPRRTAGGPAASPAGEALLSLAGLAPGPPLLHGKAHGGAARDPIQGRIRAVLIGPARIVALELEFRHGVARGIGSGRL